jgi:hypothetical protein
MKLNEQKKVYETSHLNAIAPQNRKSSGGVRKKFKNDKVTMSDYFPA